MKMLMTAALLLVAGPLLAAEPAARQTQQAEVVVSSLEGFPYAKLYHLPEAGKRPLVVILAGAEGGDGASKRFGPILARLGYAVVGLPYYSPDWGKFGPPQALAGLPGSFIDIRVDQLAELRTALRAQPAVDIDRVALFAGSKGSEFALIAASRYAWIDAVVAYAPSDLVWEGWGLETLEAEGTRSSFSFAGKPLPFMPYRGFVAGLQAGDAADLLAIHENGRANHKEREPAARIPVEKYRGKLMLIAGDRDRLWNSGRMARNIVATRKAAGLRTTALIYPEAGHDLGGDSRAPREDARGGGTPAANAAARVDAWPRMVAFLKKALRP
jgi:uncharacterized protein